MFFVFKKKKSKMIFIRMYSLDWFIKREINVFMYIDQFCNIENGTTNIYIYITKKIVCRIK